MTEHKTPEGRLSDEELADLHLVVQNRLAEDTLKAITDNFPVEQLPNWQALEKKLEQGWIEIHELRSKKSGELLSARLMVDYPARKRGEVQFLLASFVVTPDRTDKSDSSQNKSKGYGSLLRRLSLANSRSQKPNALGIVAERERPEAGAEDDNQKVRRASWMKRIGLLRLDDYDYEIPPLTSSETYTKVADRPGPSKLADLMIFPFGTEKTIAGKAVKSIVERLYTIGYAVDGGDPYLAARLAAIDEQKTYNLVSD